MAEGGGDLGGQHLPQAKQNTGDTTEDGLYSYTAYGADDTSEFTAIDKPDTTDPIKEAYNPYRYNAKRWDSATGTYDMGFRDYSPGLNRSTTRDMYTGALADMSLGTDPFTANRYAFTGGNPISFIELDGHREAPIGDGSAALTQGSTVDGRSVIYDAFGIGHILSDAADNAESAAALQAVNDDLRAAGVYYDPATGTGERYFFQDDANPTGKGVIEDGNGNLRNLGTTSDMIRVSWVNGEIVDVQDYDATGAKASQSVDMIASTISNKMDPNKKKQANNVIFVAKTEAQAEAVAERFKNDSRVRVIHSGSGFDSGRVFSSVTGGPNVQRMSPRMRGFHALGVVGSLMPLAQANSYFRSFGFWGGLREMGEDVIDPWGVLDTEPVPTWPPGRPVGLTDR